MVGHVYLILTLLVLTTAPPPSHGQLFSNEDSPSLLDKFVQLVWEPSSLIRMWVGLDQLYNIVLSWRTVAKKLASLPFGEDRSMDHVRLQEPRSLKYHKPSAASQWDRFNAIYSSSNLSPIVADMRNRLVYFPQQYGKFLGGSGLQAPANFLQPKRLRPPVPKPAYSGLPPPLFLQIEDVAVNPGDLVESANGVRHSFGDGDPEMIANLLDVQKQENERILQNEKFADQFNDVGASSVPRPVNDASVLGGPQERLNMFLKLLKTLGEEHGSDIRRESLDTSDR